MASRLAYGLECWWVFRGGRALLAIIVGFNLANVSEFFRAIPGPEDAMAGHPLVLVTVILIQIVVTMWAVWWGAGKRRRTGDSIRPASFAMTRPRVLLVDRRRQDTEIATRLV